VNSACNNVSKEYYLNINIDGTDQTPRKRLTIFNYLRKDVNEVTAGDLILHGVLQGLSPLKLQDEINFIKADGTITSSLYNAPREASSTLSSVFADSLIHDIIEETNEYGMQECFWDETTETMQMCISGAYLSGRATTISRSLQIVGNTTNKPVDENFTLCEGNNYVDCETDVTGADLLVEDDIESGGSIYSNENITAEYFIGDGSSLMNLPIDNLWNISGNYFYPSDLSKSVGIGKNDPHCRLDINGEIGLDGFEILDINNNYIALGDLDGGGSDGIKFLVDAGEVTITNNADIFADGNITTDDTGFFNLLGSLANRITKLWVQDIDVSGNLTADIIQGNYYSNDGSQGITNLTGYRVCVEPDNDKCDVWCTLQIRNGLITGCE